MPTIKLTKKEPEKKLLLSFKKKGGRGRSGRITVWHRGGGAKRLYRMIDFGQGKIGMPAKAVALEYDPFRSAFLMLLEYPDGEKRYQIAPHNIKIGEEIICQEKTEIKTGNRLRLKNIPVGTIIYNVEIEPGRGGKMIRGAGTAAKVLAHENRFTHLEMPSGEVRKVFQECFASIGQVSFPEHKFIRLGKAGRSRLLGIRPRVRGTAMNPVDHPHGGGKDKTPIGMAYPKTPWGKPARGVKTRKKKWVDKLIIQRRNR